MKMVGCRHLKNGLDKLAILIRDSMTLLKDAIDQSKPFFLIPTIQKEGQDFLEKGIAKHL